MKFTACIVAAGKGERAGGELPKQFQILSGRPMLAWSVDVFDHHPGCQQIVIACSEDHIDTVRDIVDSNATPVTLVSGGETRTRSVAACLEAAENDFVLIHDAARPGLGVQLIERLLEGLHHHKGTVPALPVADALARDTETGLTAVDRSGLLALQTPQAFDRYALLEAFQQSTGRDYPDEVSLARAMGLDVVTVQGDADNFKVTWPEDFKRMEAILSRSEPITVTGSGFDVHRLEAGDGVTLCGIRIDCPYQLVGHSDADVGLHALTDAILGAIGAGDIGQHFPPSDAEWKGASSDRFVTHALNLVRAEAGQVIHTDITLICEKPKIGPHREAMQARVADLLDLPVKRVNIKATTTEKLGFTGRGEGLAAQAVVTVMLP